MIKKLEDYTYEELLDLIAQEMFKGLLDEGSKGLRNKSWIIYNICSVWNDAQEKRKK